MRNYVLLAVTGIFRFCLFECSGQGKGYKAFMPSYMCGRFEDVVS